MIKFFKTIAAIALLGMLMMTSNAYAGDPDINDDGEVNMLDISLISSCLFQDPLAPTNAVCNSNVDTDDDDDIDFDDFYFVIGSFGQTGFPTTPVIAGSDADNNGIWDYVDTFIDTKYPSSSDKKTAAQRHVIAFQQFLIDANSNSNSIPQLLVSDEALDRGMGCLYYVNSEQDADLIADELEAVIINTVERSNIYLKASDMLAGLTLKSSRLSESCPDLLEAP